MITITHRPRSAQSFVDASANPAPNSIGGPGSSFQLGPRRRRAAAFTLVETIVATFLAAIMLPTLYASTAAGFSLVQVSRENLRATQVMVQRLEAIRLSPYSSLQNPTNFPTSATDYYCAGGATNGAGGAAYAVTYNWAVPTASTLNPTWGTNMMLVTISASWTSGKVQRTRSMQTYVARSGIQRYVAGL